MASQREFMERALLLSAKHMGHDRWRPFGAVVVLNGEIIGEGSNETLFIDDPTAHAEVVAIRDACHRLSRPVVNGGEIYCSTEPCPMCLGAIYWADIKQVYYGCRSEDLAPKGFRDDELYALVTAPRNERAILAQEFMREAALDILARFKRPA